MNTACEERGEAEPTTTWSSHRGAVPGEAAQEFHSSEVQRSHVPGDRQWVVCARVGWGGASISGRMRRS